MKIVIDARALYWTGVGRYTKELLRNLEQIDHDNQYVVAMRPQDADRWQPTMPNFQIAETPYNPYSWQEQLLLPWQLRQLKPDVVHFTNPAIPALYHGHHVTTVHDLTLLDYGSARPDQRGYTIKQKLFRWVMSRAMQGSQAIITPTEYVRDQLARRYPQAGKKLYVTPEAGLPTRNLKPLSVNRVAQPFLLYVGTYYDYKNIGRLIQAVAELANDHPGYQLVLAGQPAEFRAGLEAVARAAGVADRVVWTGFVSDAQLVWLYQHATLYVFPSLSEGFGLPGLEAMSYGLPVAAARATSLPEVYGDAAVYFDPTDTKDMARVIGETLADPQKLAALKKAGQARVKQFSWRRMAEQTLAVYQDALK